MSHAHINFNRLWPLALFGVLSSIGSSLVSSLPAKALSPTITATFMDPVGTTSLSPNTIDSSAGSFYLPVRITTENANTLSISVMASSSALIGTKNSVNTIESVPIGNEYTISQMSNQWGYRWYIGDSIYDSPNDGPNPKNYKQMPTVSTTLDTIDVKSNGLITKYLTLGFGVGVTGTTPSDSYTNEITVSVVATARELTLFDITYMQEMTTSICQNTTTPTTKTISTSANINVGPDGTTPYTDLIDTDGSKQSLDNAGDFVPQKELIDKRDGKKYTIRKLADGNCWMVSSLEFDFVPTSDKDISTGATPSDKFSTTGANTVTGSQIILTNADTDLNSITTWTPDVATSLYGTAGTVYLTQKNAGRVWAANGADGLRSFSNEAAFPSDPYSTKTATTPAFGTADSGAPWQKIGNFYNWTAATLGSSTKVKTNGDNAEDSICPVGWKLPNNTGDGSFANLLDNYGLPKATTSDAFAKVNQLANFPLNFLRTGYYYPTNGSVLYRTTYSDWWSATRYSTDSTYVLNSNLGRIAPQYDLSSGHGFAIRCVARKE